MAEERKPPKPLSDDFWDALNEGNPLPVDLDFEQALTRAPTTREVEYLISRFPFLIIENPEAKPIDKTSRKQIKAESGWLIYDEGDQISTTPGRLVYGGYRSSDEDEGEGGDEGGGAVSPSGSMTQQFMDTATQMINLAIEKAWPFAKIVDGYRPMQQAALMAAEEKRFSLRGIVSSKEERTVSEHIKGMGKKLSR